MDILLLLLSRPPTFLNFVSADFSSLFSQSRDKLILQSCYLEDLCNVIGVSATSHFNMTLSFGSCSEFSKQAGTRSTHPYCLIKACWVVPHDSKDVTIYSRAPTHLSDSVCPHLHQSRSIHKGIPRASSGGPGHHLSSIRSGQGASQKAMVATTCHLPPASLSHYSKELTNGQTVTMFYGAHHIPICHLILDKGAPHLYLQKDFFLYTD